MRYIIRRSKPEELSEIREQIPDLETLVGKPAENLRRVVPLSLSPLRSIHFLFLTRKTESGWTWVCPSVELNAENEKGLFALADHLHVPRPTHLPPASPTLR